MAKKLTIIDEGHIEIYPDHGWSLSFVTDPVRRGELVKQNTEELLEKVNQLRGVQARAVYERRYDCSSCGFGFELDPETGRTACCDEEVEA